ncbi:MAG: hypothetical protein A3F68_08825 [Acidobacteria bacterium RIFCSPLOWO2_12_FULL_54_10]|nr:MAG: hypothetical protein A3F68_08825 [Acidobacteria bacterium RIFCSPLOWO2_12_FULL_54_10]
MRKSLLGSLLVGFSIWLLLQPAISAAPVTDSNVYPPPDYYTFQPPGAGSGFTDPVFGTSVKRLSNALGTPNLDAGGNLIFITDEYSTASPFNADNSRILLVYQSYFALYDGSGNYLKTLPFEINSSSEPRWSHTNADILYYLFVNQLKQYNISTGAMSTVHTFSEYSSISGKGESDISYDGNHFVLVGDNRYVFVYEISTNTKGPSLDANGKGFDSVYITPNNNVTVTWLQAGTSRYNGIELFDRNLNFLRQVAHAGGHMDVTLDTDGSEVLVWTNSNDALPLAGCNNGFVKIRLSTGQQSCLLSIDWTLAVHISGTDNSGWVFAETYAPSDPSPQSSNWVAYTNEILQIKLDGTEVRRLLQYRSRPFNSYNYMPRVSASHDGSRFIYSSNYGLQAILGYPSEYSDVYLATLSGTPTPEPGAPSITTSSLPDGTQNTTYSATVAATGGTPGYTWSISAGNLPAGLTIGSSTGVISGTPTGSGTSSFTVQARDAASQTASKTLSLTLNSAVTVNPPSITTSSLPDGTQHTAYSAAMTATGGTPGYAWSISAGSLPAGLTIGSSTGVISGTPTGTGTSSFTVKVTDAGAMTATQSLNLTVNGGSTSTTSTTHAQETDTPVSYTGTWYPISRSFFDGGSAKEAMDAGARVTFTFTGTGIRWIGYRDEWSGKANIYLDGQFKAVVDTFASPAQAQAVIWSATGLTASTHTLAIEATGTHSASSGGAWIWIDAFDVDTATTGTVPRIEQDNAAVSYTGTWFPNTLPVFSGGSATLSADTGSKATLRFTGTGVSWIGYRAQWCGIARVYLDGNMVGKIDTYSATETANAVLYKATGLSRGSHTLTIHVSGQRSRSSSGAWIWVDGFDVTP